MSAGPPTARPVGGLEIVGRRLYQFFSGLLFDPIAFAWKVLEFPAFVANLVRYRISQGPQPSQRFKVRLRYLFPVLGERHAAAGVASGHYFHQDIWAARLIREAAPRRHVDVGSSVAGFVAHLLTFREVEYVDLRRLDTNVTGLNFTQGSILSLPLETDSVESLSALHVVEHIGLGRYGDPIDPDGWRKAIEELKRVLAPEGRLYFSTPIGTERLEFDAHRVFDPATILEEFKPLCLVDFDYVDDAGNMAPKIQVDRFSGWYCCGLFVLTKSAAAG